MEWGNWTTSGADDQIHIINVRQMVVLCLTLGYTLRKTQSHLHRILAQKALPASNYEEISDKLKKRIFYLKMVEGTVLSQNVNLIKEKKSVCKNISDERRLKIRGNQMLPALVWILL